MSVPRKVSLVLTLVQLTASTLGQIAEQCDGIATSFEINNAPLPDSACQTLASDFATAAPFTEEFYNEAVAEAPSESTSDKKLLKDSFQVVKEACDVSLSSLLPTSVVLAVSRFTSEPSRTTRSTVQVKRQLRKLA